MINHRAVRIIKTSVIMVFATIFATLGLNAADNIDDLSNSMLGSVFFSEKSQCPNEMVFVPSDTGGFCIDIYESSLSNGCPYFDPINQMESQYNLEQAECIPVSVENSMPWRNISLNQAQSACAKVGKRLPTNKEWYHAALGTPDGEIGRKSHDCNLGDISSDGPKPTGLRESCISSVGTYDMIGNLWEWVDGTVYSGIFNDIPVVGAGYVAGVDNEGFPTETKTTPQSFYYGDYFWIRSDGIYGMLRGGYYGNDDKAGIYAINATVPHSFVGVGVGFRCVK